MTLGLGFLLGNLDEEAFIYSDWPKEAEICFCSNSGKILSKYC